MTILAAGTASSASFVLATSCCGSIDCPCTIVVATGVAKVFLTGIGVFLYCS
ncbi:hypothetical protein EFM7_1377 [Enterococcus faecalis M7]|nr:hypothetical protein OG1X_2349 [Enterococcus faecalis OG1X]ELA05390.1 hypothetical protein EFM7_1377 [Enterococcus faecalis M7]